MAKGRREKESRRKSRSRSKERESRHEPRKRSHRHREEESSDDSDTPSPVKVSKRDTVKREQESEAPSGSRQEELSIEETNKLRISLGLKPLEVDGAPKDASESKDGSVAPMKTEEVFVKTENISDKLEAERIRERVEIQKEKRLQQEKLKKIKPLGHESSDEEADDPLAWIQRSRELEKRKAEEKERQLQEMDDEIQKQNEEKELIRKHNLYKERDLKGLTVGHSLDNIKEGSQIILTLRDRGLLDEEESEDVLENVNIIDQEKAAENVLNKKLGKRDYNPYDDDEDKNLLSKYDETIDGKKKDSFKLGHNLEEEISERLKRAQEEAKLSGKILVNLDELSGPSMASSNLKFATEYYTEEEMKKFRRPKKMKMKKTSMRKRVEEEELAPVATKSSDPDLASRSKKRKEEEPEEGGDEAMTSVEKAEEAKKFVPTISLMDIDEDNDNNVDVSGVVLEDDGAEDELQAALEKARRLREKKSKSSVEQIASLIAVKREKSMDTEEAGTSSGLGMNSLAEFCRNIGESSQVKVEYDSDMNDSEDEEDQVVIKKPKEKSDLKPLIRSSDPQVKVDSKKERKGKWTEVNDMEVDKESSDEEESRSKSKDASVKATPILGEEPDLTVGVAAALKLAMNKGYLERDSRKSGAVPKSTKLSAVNYLIDEKFGGGDDRRNNRDRYSGRVSEFQEKSNYRPEVNLEYIDDEGRILNEKEAFRQLSHKFHGKGSGKNKIDKRMQKLKQESKLRQMSSIDTPLNTVKKLQEKQKELQSPYVVISGTEAALIKKK